jgi:hypothetical protein
MDKTNNLFTIKLSADWEDRTVHTFMGPDDSGVQHIITLVVDPEVGDEDLFDFARERIDTVIDSMQSITVLKDEPKTLKSGREAYEFVYRWIPMEGKVIYKKQIYMLIDGKGYIFGGDFSRKTIKTIGLEMDQMIDSFEPGCPERIEDE